MSNLPYRPCVGIMLKNRDGLIWTGERLDTLGAWQMPQGGIDDGEELAAAALRELSEETSVQAHHVTLIAQTPNWISYDLPDHLIGKVWKGRYRGQKQHWFLAEFLGEDKDISIEVAHPEFGRWRWSTPEQLLADIVPFKRGVYQSVLDIFQHHLS